MSIPQLQPVRRCYHYGQLLSAYDLQDNFQAETQLRWWHTVGLHNTWGIALGLDVDIVGPRARVAPGLAYDSFGREIILAEEAEVSLPTEGRHRPQPTNWVLVASYDAASNFTPLSEIDFVCPGAQTGSNPDRLTFIWRRPERVQLGLEVPLVQVSLSMISPSIDIRVRHYVRSTQRPHLAGGHTLPGSRWQPWTGRADSKQHIGWAIKIDTTEAGFRASPHYFASFVGDGFDLEPEPARRLLGPFTFIAQVKPVSFTFVPCLPYPPGK